MLSKDNLKRRHEKIEETIEQEMKRPAPDMLRISQLKKEKLLLKEQLIS